MHRVADKTILYFSCSILYVLHTGICAETIVILLSLILVACCNIIIEQLCLTFHLTNTALLESAYYQGAYILLLLLTFAKPLLIVFLPVLLYDCYRYRHKTALVLCALLLLSHVNTLEPLSYTVLLLLCCISIMLSDYGNKKESLTKELIAQRDDSVEHARLIEANNEMLRQKQDAAIYTATLQERNRIAREIHDNVGHLLTRSILQTGAIKTINQDEHLTEPITMLNDTLNTAMTSIRNSVHDLHDESVDLKAAIEDIISSAKNFDVSFEYDMGKHLSRDIKYAFIAITKEGINNCLKYSNGSKIHILLREHPGFYQLMIEDNGTDIHISEDSGMGLTNIKERAASIHGTAKIMTDKGFRILITALKEGKQ